MIEYIGELFDAAFNGDTSGTRRFAFLQLLIIAIIGLGVPFRILMGVSDYVRSKRQEKALHTEVSVNAPIGATKAEIAQLAREERARRRAEIFETPPIPIRLARRPANSSFWQTVAAFAKEKDDAHEILNDYERLAIGPVGLATTLMGSAGPAHLDSYGDKLPFKGWELRAAMERVGLADIGEVLERAVAIQLHRHQLMTDFIATGMPKEQALAHPELPDYADLADQLQRRGGMGALERAADIYFEAAYPWAE